VERKWLDQQGKGLKASNSSSTTPATSGPAGGPTCQPFSCLSDIASSLDLYRKASSSANQLTKINNLVILAGDYM